MPGPLPESLRIGVYEAYGNTVFFAVANDIFRHKKNILKFIFIGRAGQFFLGLEYTTNTKPV